MSITKEFLYQEYVNNQRSINEIAQSLRCSTATIHKRLVFYNIPRRKSGGSSNIIHRITKDDLYDEYVNKDRSIHEVAATFGCGSTTILKRLKQYGIERRKRGGQVTINISKKDLYEEYVNQRRTCEEIAESYDCYASTIYNKLVTYGIPRRRSGTDYKDLAGETYRLLTAVERIGTSNNGAKWKCKCRCGNYTTITAGQWGRTRSCGCISGVDHKCWKGTASGTISGYVWCQIQCGAKTRNLPFTITIEYAEALFVEQNGKCALSGIQIVFRSKGVKQTASLDRKDSSQGYIPGNVQWVHKDVNFMKRTLSNADFINFCMRVVEYNR